MKLFFHLSIHILTSLAAGYIVWKIRKKPAIAFSIAFIGGVLIDLDHLIDYWLAFIWNFRLDYFAKGYQFLKSDKIYILFHGWEYAIILTVLAIWVIKNKTAKSIILALGISMFFHLSTDLFLNEGAKIGTYSVIYRAKNNFDLKPLVTLEHFLDHQRRKKLININ